MSGTFRSVVRPNKVLITTDLAGVLSFAGRATSFIFSSGQSAALSSVTNTEHLIDSQLVEIYNQGSSNINIAAGLMSAGLAIDVEPGTVQILLWSTSTSKFVDVGGTAATKNLEIDYLAIKAAYLAHAHTGTGTAKVKATDLDPTGGSSADFLILDSFGQPVWNDPLTGTSEQNYQIRNTDIATQLNNPTPTIVPIAGVVDIANAYFSISGNGILVGNFTGYIKANLKLNMTYGNTNIVMRVDFLKNGVAQPGYGIASGNGYAPLNCIIDVVPGDLITVQLTRVANTGNITLDGMNSTLLVTIPTSALARGTQGLPGTPGWIWRSGFGVPSAGLGVNQDLYLDKTSMNLYEKISGTWTLQVNIKGDTGGVGPSRVMIWAERAGTLTNNTDQWSFGAANTTVGKGLVMMGSGRVTKLSLQTITAGTTTKTVEIMKNGVSSGQSITVAATVVKGTVVLSTPVTFVDGDVIGFRTVLAGGASNARVAAVIELD